MSSMKTQMKKAGEAIDRGMASILRETGQNIHTVCPACSKEVRAPADELVECPACKHHFRSPTVSARTAEIGRSMKEDIQKAFKTSEETGEGESGRATGA